MNQLPLQAPRPGQGRFRILDVSSTAKYVFFVVVSISLFFWCGGCRAVAKKTGTYWSFV